MAGDWTASLSAAILLDALILAVDRNGPFVPNSPITPMPPILETPRLILREMTADDLDFVASMLADPEVMRYYPRCYSRDEAATWIQRQRKRYARHGHGLWLAVNKDTGTPIGQVGLTIQRIRNIDEKELGYFIHRDHWGHGYATEAAQACRDFAFHVLQRARVFALIRSENVASLRVAIKLGLTREPLVIEHSRFKHQVYSKGRSEEG